MTLVNKAIGYMENLPLNAVQVLARLGIGTVFLLSGQTKVDGWKLSENAVFLFKEEYKLPLLDPTFAATMAAISEHVFPILLFVGLFTRFAALALLGMTLVIQIFVYPGAYGTHALWASALLFLMKFGGGCFSLDALIGKSCKCKL